MIRRIAHSNPSKACCGVSANRTVLGMRSEAVPGVDDAWEAWCTLGTKKHHEHRSTLAGAQWRDASAHHRPGRPTPNERHRAVLGVSDQVWARRELLVTSQTRRRWHEESVRGHAGSWGDVEMVRWRVLVDAGRGVLLGRERELSPVYMHLLFDCVGVPRNKQRALSLTP